QPRADDREHRTADCRQQPTAPKADPRRQAEAHQQNGRGISADAKESGVAERDQPRVTTSDVPRRRQPGPQKCEHDHVLEALRYRGQDERNTYNQQSDLQDREYPAPRHERQAMGPALLIYWSQRHFWPYSMTPIVDVPFWPRSPLGRKIIT